MANKARLDNRQREFFHLVDRAAFCNPFSAERLILDRQISDAPATFTEVQVAQGAVSAVSARVAELDRQGAGSLRHFSGQDRQALHSAFLFEVFHRFAGDFDRLIGQQIAAGDAPCPVPFAGDALLLLQQRGFGEDEACRYFAFFFQMRRAFYFLTAHLTGHSPALRELRQRLWNNLFTHDSRWYERYLWNRMEDFSTLLLGETGSGKGAAAAALGRSGFIPFHSEKGRFAESFTRNFISVNLSRFPEALIESELFGHKKGAFTGAIGDHQGVLSRCMPHGAIFLDEIGDVSAPVQVKLLQILQERIFSPVGSHEKLRFHGRVIAATNRPLDRLRAQGEFRDDFFYRLCSDVIVLPTLRQRLRESPQEMELLLGGVVQRTIGAEAPGLAQELRRILDREPGPDYPWPGNVRELEQAARRILLSGRYQGESPPASQDGRERLLSQIDAGALDAQQVVASYCALLYQRFGTYEQVARVTGLDRRTVKKHLLTTGGGEGRN